MRPAKSEHLHVDQDEALIFFLLLLLLFLLSVSWWLECTTGESQLCQLGEAQFENSLEHYRHMLKEALFLVSCITSLLVQSNTQNAYFLFFFLALPFKAFKSTFTCKGKLRHVSAFAACVIEGTHSGSSRNKPFLPKPHPSFSHWLSTDPFNKDLFDIAQLGNQAVIN